MRKACMTIWDVLERRLDKILSDPRITTAKMETTG